MTEINRIGKRLREARENATPKITQADLAAKLQTSGVYLDETAISKIEKDKRRVSDIEAAAIANSLNINLLWLLGISDEK